MESPYEAPVDTSPYKPPATILLDEPSDPTKAGDNFKDYRKEEWPQSEAANAIAARQDPRAEKVVRPLFFKTYLIFIFFFFFFYVNIVGSFQRKLVRSLVHRF